MTHDAFAEAYATFYPQIVRFLRGMLSGRGDAADVAQEVFLRLHASEPAVERDVVRFWLFRVARNLALNELRRVSVRERLRAFIGIGVRDDDDPHTRLVRDEQRQLLMTHLARLRPDHRAALLLCEWEEMTYDQIALTLGISIAKVKTDIFRARQSLRAVMAEGRK